MIKQVVQQLVQALPEGLARVDADDFVWFGPTEAAALATLLQTAGQYPGLTLMPDLGQPIETDRRWSVLPVSWELLNEIVRLRADEYLITVQPGMTVGEMNRILAPHRQRLGTLYPSSRTLLSLIGQDLPCLTQGSVGSFRQQVTGIKALTGAGEPFKYGGEVVKNVTGYDMVALLVGSRHQYGLPVEVTLKTVPIPEMERRLVIDLQPVDETALPSTPALMSTFVDEIKNLQAELNTLKGIALFRLRASIGWKCLLDCGGWRNTVQPDMERLQAWVQALDARGPGLHELDCEASAFDHWLDKLDWQRPGQSYNLVLKVALPTAQAREFLVGFATADWFDAADCLWYPDAGVMYLRWRSPNYPYSAELETIVEWVEQHHDGLVTLAVRPVNIDLPDTLAQPKEPEAFERWRYRLRQLYDPNGLLGPPV
ncbi:MAG: FAD-binding oxidoreductase [Cyanobacteria bacterium HKST-UBA04]|nr:FAD-binding oxidoreductase [Cyanobacteria bacterium HKST-UBA04]